MCLCGGELMFVRAECVCVLCVCELSVFVCE